MFLPESRYAKLPQCQVTLPDGTTATAVKLRMLPQVSGDPTPMTADDRLDINPPSMSTAFAVSCGDAHSCGPHPAPCGPIAE